MMTGGTGSLHESSAAARRNTATSRWNILRRHVENGEPLTQLAAIEGIGLRTLQRWHAAYRSEGIAGLAPAEPPKRGRRTHPELVVLIEGLAVSKPRMSMTSIFRKAQRTATQRT